MPQMDGIETLAKLREIFPEKYESTPIISLTASAVSGDKEKMLNAGFTDYLTKPINFDEMDKMMVRYLPADSVIMVEDDAPKEGSELKKLPPEIFECSQSVMLREYRELKAVLHRILEKSGEQL